MVKTNIYLSRNKIPIHIQSYRIRTSLINVDFNELERHVFNNGWYCFRYNEYTIFIRISEPSIEDISIPNEWISGPLESFIWEIINVNALNKFKICFNAAFRRAILNSSEALFVKKSKPIIRKDYSISPINQIESAQGIIYQPCLVNKRLGIILHLKRFFPKNILMNDELLKITQLNPSSYFTELNQFIHNNFPQILKSHVGQNEYIFNFTSPYVQDDTDIFKVSILEEEEELRHITNKLNKVEDFELEEEDIENNLRSLKIYSDFSNPDIILPNNIVVGRGQTSNWRKNQPLKPIWEFLKSFGPYQVLDLIKLWIIPIYDSRYSEFRDNVKDICTDLVNFGRYYRNPGLKKWLSSTDIRISQPISVDIQGDINAWVTRVIQEHQDQDNAFPDRFRKDSGNQVIFIIQIPNVEEYYEIKRVLSHRGIPSQMISNVSVDDDNFKYYRWNLLTSIYAKLKGRVWAIQSRNKGRISDLNLILGFRFKKPSGKNYVIAIATILTGSGEFLGYYAENFDITHYESSGMKLTEQQILTILNNLNAQFLSHLHDPSILITRLGPMPPEERDLFVNRLEQLNITKYAICTFTRDLLRMSTITEGFLPLGTYIEHTKNESTILPIGDLTYKMGKWTKNLSNRLYSIPTSIFLRLEINKNLYIENEEFNPIYSAAKDIMNLCWLNWQNVYFPISGMPVSLSYAEKLANFLSREIIANGDLRETPWFI